jgi:hypothetical protein
MLTSPKLCKQPSCGQRFSQLGNLKVVISIGHYLLLLIEPDSRETAYWRKAIQVRHLRQDLRPEGQCTGPQDRTPKDQTLCL